MGKMRKTGAGASDDKSKRMCREILEASVGGAMEGLRLEQVSLII